MPTPEKIREKTKARRQKLKSYVQEVEVVCKRTTKTKELGLCQGFAFTKQGFQLFMEEYMAVHQSWMATVKCISIAGDEGKGSFKVIASFNSETIINPREASILLYYGNFRENSLALQSVLMELHLEVLEKIAKEMKIPMVLTGDTKYLRSLFNLGDGGHPKGKN